jgi:hypothetical protein
VKAPPRPVSYLPVIVALLAGGWFAWQSWVAWTRYLPIGAVIVSAKVDTMVIVGKPSYHPDITFEYVSDGFTQTSSTVLKGNPAMSERSAAKYVNRYPVGTVTTAYVSATDAEDIVLIRENHWLLPLLIGALGFAALLFLVWQDREAWLPKVQRMLKPPERATPAEWNDPRGRPPKMEMHPPPGMEGAHWDPTPDEEGLPRGWVKAPKS